MSVPTLPLNQEPTLQLDLDIFFIYAEHVLPKLERFLKFSSPAS
jgi:hypothetical protein